MLEYLTLKQESFGLDISDLSLKFAKLKKRGKFFSLVSWGEIELEPGIVEDGEVKNDEALAEAIRKGVAQVKGERLKTKNVIVSLPEKKAFLQVIQMPKMAEEELKTAVSFEAENYIPLPIERVYLDFQTVLPVQDGLDHLDILIAAIPKDIVEPYIACLKKAGLKPQALEIESQSITRALIKNGITYSPVFIIDFGRSSTNFIIFSGYSLRFTSSISISSQKLTQAISKFLKVDLVEAEALKLKYGLDKGSGQTPLEVNPVRDYKDRKKAQSKQISNGVNGSKKKHQESRPLTGQEGKKINKTITPILTDLVREVAKHINYYHNHKAHEHLPPNGREIGKILLCGRGSNLKGFPDFLFSQLKIPIEIANPWLNILPEPLKEVPGLPFKESLSYTTVLGLALRGISEARLHLN